MHEIEIKKKCQGRIHRVRIRIEKGAIVVSCPDHDFDLDEIQEAMEVSPQSRNFCLGVYAGWTGMRDVTLDQVQACIQGARSHGLTSKAAREVFGFQVAELLYLGIRSPRSAEQLLSALVWPTRVPFDPAAAERFVQCHPTLERADFAVAATAGGIGFDQSDVDWLEQEGVGLSFAVERLYEPQMWRLTTGNHTRGELNQWWRTARSLIPRGNGQLIINLVAALPIPLTDLQLLPMDELELLATIREPQGLLLARRLITDFDIRDAPTLAALVASKWTPKDLSGSVTEVQFRARGLLRKRRETS